MIKKNSDGTDNINVTNTANIKLNNGTNTKAGLIGIYTTADSKL